MTAGDLWAVLGIAATDDVREVRRAYARALKTIDPEADPAAFIALRDARDRAMYAAESHVPVDEKVPPADDELPSPPEEAFESPVLEVDFVALQDLHAMVFDPESRATADAIMAQTERVLADPAMTNLDHAARVEHFLADTIAQGTPRSDPMIDAAVARFRWKTEDAVAYRPPAVEWILQRSEDRYFEVSLNASAYVRLLRSLRKPPPRRWGGLIGWWYGTRVEFLIAILQTSHPTVLAGLDQATLQWWFETIDRQHRAFAPIRWLREGDRRLIWGVELSGYHNRLKLLGQVALLSFFFWAMIAAPTVSGPAGTSGPIVYATDTADLPAVPAPALGRLPFEDMRSDINRFVARVTDGGLTESMVAQRNPTLHARLAALWREGSAQAAVTGADPDALNRDFERTANVQVEQTFAAALRRGDDDFVRDHARFYDSRLRWAVRIGADACVDAMSGRGDESPSLRDYRTKLLTRAVLSGVKPDAAADGGTFRIPPPVFDDAVKRSGLDQERFRRAGMGKGSAADRCTAAIALVDAAIVRPGKDGLKMLRAMFGR